MKFLYSYIFKNSALTLIFNGINVITQAVMFTLISNTEFGIFAVVVSFTLTVDTILTMPFGHYLYSLKQSEREKIINSIYTLSAIFISMRLIIFMIIFIILKDKLEIYFISILLIIISNIVAFYNNLQLIQEDLQGGFTKVTIIRGMSTISGSLLAVILAYIQPSYLSLVARETLPSFFMFGAIYLSIGHKSWTFRFEIDQVKCIILKTVPFQLSSISERVFSRLPYLLFAPVISAEQLGAYYKLFYVVGLCNTAAATFHQRIFYAKLADHKNPQLYYSEIKRNFLYVITLLSFIFFILLTVISNLQLFGYTPENFYQYIILLPISFILPFYNIKKTILYNQGKAQFVTLAYLGGVVIVYVGHSLFINFENGIYYFVLILYAISFLTVDYFAKVAAIK